jgi:hypothetical protein
LTKFYNAPTKTTPQTANTNKYFPVLALRRFFRTHRLSAYVTGLAIMAKHVQTATAEGDELAAAKRTGDRTS